MSGFCLQLVLIALEKLFKFRKNCYVLFTQYSANLLRPGLCGLDLTRFDWQWSGSINNNPTTVVTVLLKYCQILIATQKSVTSSSFQLAASHSQPVKNDSDWLRKWCPHLSFRNNIPVKKTSGENQLSLEIRGQTNKSSKECWEWWCGLFIKCNTLCLFRNIF